MDIAELGMLLETIDADTVSPEEFSIAADRIRQLKLDDDQKLQLYGLYKQATVGDIDAPKPWAIQIADSAKWYSPPHPLASPPSNIMYCIEFC